MDGDKEIIAKIKDFGVLVKVAHILHGEGVELELALEVVELFGGGGIEFVPFEGSTATPKFDDAGTVASHFKGVDHGRRNGCRHRGILYGTCGRRQTTDSQRIWKADKRIADREWLTRRRRGAEMGGDEHRFDCGLRE